MYAFNWIAAVLVQCALLASVAGASSPNDDVRVEARAASATMRSGSSGAVELRFFPVEGFHVNLDPPVQFSLDSAVALDLAGKPVMTADSVTGYLSTTVPVQQAIIIRDQTPPGLLIVKGTVTYFYCSEREGWCNRRKQPVEFTISVIR